MIDMRNCRNHRYDSTKSRTQGITTHARECSRSSSVHRAPDKKATVPLYKVLARTGLESNSRPTAAQSLTDLF